MINFSVPVDHPLTAMRHAAICVTVVDMSNQECGVYPDVDRAFLYICDWFKGATNPSTVELHQVNDDYWHVKVDGTIQYRIKRTSFRY